MTSIAKRFELLTDRYRLADGSRWTGKKLEDATGGRVTRSYVSALKKGTVAHPSYDKLDAISRAMGFPIELWSRDTSSIALSDSELSAKAPLAKRVENLFQTVVDAASGETYSNADIARMSYGDLTPEEVADIRSGKIADPTFDQVLSLAEAFGVSPSYFLEKAAPLISQEALEALSRGTPSKVVSKTLDLAEEDQEIVLNIMENLGYLRDPDRNSDSSA